MPPAAKPPSARAGIKGLPEISFWRGLNSIQQNFMLLKDGECAALVNPDLDVFGGIGIRSTLAEKATGLGSVHSIYKQGNNLWVGHGTVLSRILVTTWAETTVITGLSGANLCMRAVGNWLLVSDGTNRKKVYISTLATYNWGFDKPAAAPTAVAGAAGNPDGTYSLYYSHVAKYPDGTEHESDLSPAGSVVVSSEAITWTLPGTVSDSQITHFRLYRDKPAVTLSQPLDTLRSNVEASGSIPIGSLHAGIIPVLQQVILRETTKKVVQDTIQDSNVIVGPFQVTEIAVGTASVSDDLTDATLELKIPHTNENFSAVKAFGKFTYKAKRIFGTMVTGFNNVLWWGQPYQWDSLEAGWDGYNSTTFDDDTDTALLDLEGMLYVGAKSGWLRLRGSTPADWSLDPTHATIGPATDRTCDVTPLGIVYPRENGLWAFNGYTARLVAPQVKNLLASVNWDSASKAFSLWDGRYYRFFYPKGTATENDRELVIDTIAGEADLRPAETDLAVSAGYFDKVTQKTYFGTTTGKILEGAGSASRTLSITTKEFIVGDGFNVEAKGQLHYDVDTKGEALNVTAVYDGVDQIAFAIVEDGRKKSSHSLPKGNCKRIGFKLSIASDQNPILYEPWFIE